MDRFRRSIVTLSVLGLFMMGAVPAAAGAGIEARILHQGLDPEQSAVIILLDKGAGQGITEGAIYRMQFGGQDYGELKILETLPGSSIGAFTPGEGKAAPEIGAAVRLEPAAGGSGDGGGAPAGESGAKDVPAPGAETGLMSQGQKVVPNDVLGIKALPQGKLPDETTVRPDGTISLPYVGVIEVAGMTVFEISNLLQDRLASDFKRPWAEVTINESKNNLISIFGEIRTSQWRKSGPGEYLIQENTRIIELLSLVGGLTDDADMKNIKLIRKDGSEKTINLERAIDSPDSEDNTLVMTGDVIYVPTTVTSRIRVTVLGLLTKQGIFHLEAEHKGVLDAVSEAGGMTPDAALDKIAVIRNAGGKKQIFNVDLSVAAAEKDAPDFQLQDGDLVHVPARTQKNRSIDRLNSILSDISPAIQTYWFIDRFSD